MFYYTLKYIYMQAVFLILLFLFCQIYGIKGQNRKKLKKTLYFASKSCKIKWNGYFLSAYNTSLKDLTLYAKIPSFGNETK